MNSTTAGRIAATSIAVAIVVLGLKSLAAWQSGSLALFSDAVESVVNVATAIAAFAAVLYARRPPDEDHPFGHEKAEYFVALFEALMIGAAAFAIAQPAALALWRGSEPVDIPAAAYAANIAAGVVNGAWCLVLVRQGRALKSAALESDGWHLFSDVASSAGVLVGVTLAQATGYGFLDPLLALLVAVNILWSGWRLLMLSVDGLMDKAPDAPTRSAIASAIAKAGGEAMQAHDIRARVSGPATFIEFHLVVDGEMSVDAAHAICDAIEASLRQSIPGARISIHVEPGWKAHPRGGLDLAAKAD